MPLNHEFFIHRDELNLRFTHPDGERMLSFVNANLRFDEWKTQCQAKLRELLNIELPSPSTVTELRRTQHEGVEIRALVMEVDHHLSIPAYLLYRKASQPSAPAVMAIHGHGEVEPCIGSEHHDYHHQFALRLAQEGYLVLCPELRGFGVLKDLAHHKAGHRLDYWTWDGPKAYSLVTDGFLKGHTLIGATVEDLLRWEGWLVDTFSLETIKVAGISYGGDLALTYPVFSDRVERIFASGTLGSFRPIFSQCYNAPAHCIPNVLRWMDRADIAGLNAPRPLALHYGALDTPGDGNYSASYNETVPDSIEQLKQIYAAIGAENRVELIVTPDSGHEMDNEALLAFLSQ
jgi:dienelactone hydrolase